MKSVPISFLVWCGLPPCRFRPLCVVLFVPPSHLCTVWGEGGCCWGLWSSQTGSETPGNMDQLAAQSGITSPDLPVLVPLSPLHKLPVSSSLLVSHCAHCSWDSTMYPWASHNCITACSYFQHGSRIHASSVVEHMHAGMSYEHHILAGFMDWLMSGV